MTFFETIMVVNQMGLQKEFKPIMDIMHDAFISLKILHFKDNLNLGFSMEILS